MKYLQTLYLKLLVTEHLYFLKFQMSVINLSNIILASSSDCGIESLSPKSRSSPGAWLVNCVEATKYEREREREREHIFVIGEVRNVNSQ